MKRAVCILFLLPAISFFLLLSAQAVPKIDGNVHWTEYGAKPVVLIHSRNESNNDVSYAFLCQCVSAEDYSVYIGVKYVCDDLDVMLRALREAETADEDDVLPAQPMTGIEVSINGEKCCTALFDGTVNGLNTDRYDADAKFFFFDDTDTDNPDTNNFDGEVRLGVKYWIPYNSVLGLRILDCSGIPSNFYEIPINPEPTTAATAAAAAAAEKQSADRSSTTKKQKETATTASTTSKTTTEPVQTTLPRTTVRVITAAMTASRTETTGTAAAETQSGTTKETVARPASTTDTPSSSTRTAARIQTDASTDPPTEALTTAEPSPSETAVSTVQPSSTLRGGRLFGVVAAAVLLTATVMTSVFIGVQKSGRDASLPEPLPPEEEEEIEPDDF